jgi:hypothetical protein
MHQQRKNPASDSMRAWCIARHESQINNSVHTEIERIRDKQAELERLHREHIDRVQPAIDSLLVLLQEAESTRDRKRALHLRKELVDCESRFDGKTTINALRADIEDLQKKIDAKVMEILGRDSACAGILKE